MKNIKALLGSLAIAAILGANGYMAMSGTKAQTELTLQGVERMAEGEGFWSRLVGKKYRDEKYDCLVHGYRIYYADGHVSTTEEVPYISGSANGEIVGVVEFTSKNKIGHQCPTGSDYCEPIECW